MGFINQKSRKGDADAEADESSGSEDEDDGRAAGRDRILKMRSGQRLMRFLDTPSETEDLLGMSSYLELRSVAPASLKRCRKMLDPYLELGRAIWPSDGN